MDDGFFGGLFDFDNDGNMDDYESASELFVLNELLESEFEDEEDDDEDDEDDEDCLNARKQASCMSVEQAKAAAQRANDNYQRVRRKNAFDYYSRQWTLNELIYQYQPQKNAQCIYNDLKRYYQKEAFYDELIAAFSKWLLEDREIKWSDIEQ